MSISHSFNDPRFSRRTVLLVLWAAVFPVVLGDTIRAEAVFEQCNEKLGLELGNSAAAWCDYDNDGWVDLCAGGVLWRNEQGKSFGKVATLGAGVFGDFDNDGFADYFSWSQRALLRNVEGQTFEKTDLPQMSDCVSRGAACGDFNGDGYLDVYVGGYEDWGKGITYPDMILLNRRGASLDKAWSESRYRARGQVYRCRRFAQCGCDVERFCRRPFDRGGVGRLRQ